MLPSYNRRLERRSCIDRTSSSLSPWSSCFGHFFFVFLPSLRSISAAFPPLFRRLVVVVFVIASAVIVFGQQTQRGQCPVEQGISVRSSVCLYELTYFLTSVRPLCPLQDSSPPRPNLLWSQGPIPSKLPLARGPSCSPRSHSAPVITPVITVGEKKKIQLHTCTTSKQIELESRG